MIGAVMVAIAMAALAAFIGMYGGSELIPETWMYVGLAAMVITASTVTSMVGLGGGPIVVSVLLFMGMPPPVAASASLATTFSNAAGSVMTYARQHRIDYWAGVRIGAMAVPGGMLGAIFTSEADPTIFGILLSSGLTVAAVYILISPRLRHRSVPGEHWVLVISAAASFFAGVMSSYFGVGGGIVFVPFLVVVAGMTLAKAAPTSMFALLMTSMAGIGIHAMLGHTDAVLALLLSAGGLLGGLSGARLSLAIEEKYLRTTAVTIMLVVAVKLAWDSITNNIDNTI